MLSTARTMIRPLVVGVLGTVISWEPSLATLEAKTVSKVIPPSAENRTSTVAVLIGALEVPATFQVTVSAELPFQVLPPF